METTGFFQFEIIINMINALVSFFCFSGGSMAIISMFTLSVQGSTLDVRFWRLTLSVLNLPLSSSSTTSRELLPQFSTCNGMKMIWSGWKNEKNCHVLVNQFHGNIHPKTCKSPSYRKIKSVFRDVKWCFNASWGLKGLESSYTFAAGIANANSSFKR